MIPYAEMGIYRDSLSAIVIGDNLLPIIVIAENSFDLSITDIALATYFVIADKLSRQNDSLCTQCSNFKVSKLALWKKHTVSTKSCCSKQKSLFVLFNAEAESVNCSFFFKNLEKHFGYLTYKKNFVKHLENLPQHLAEKFIGNNLSITDIALRN